MLALVDRIPRDCWPTLIRGDSGISSESVMREAESRSIAYLFKLRLTKNVKRLIERTFAKGGRPDAGQGWKGKEATLRLEGWSQQRRVIVLRRRLKGSVVASMRDDANQLRLGFAGIEDDTALWEYAVLVTSVVPMALGPLDEKTLTIAQLYRDRAAIVLARLRHGENVFDELKNQWAGAASPRMISRVAGSRPAWSRWSTTGGTSMCASPSPTSIWKRSPAARCCSPHRRTHPPRPPDHAAHCLDAWPRRLGRASWVEHVLTGVTRFLRGRIATTEQLTADQRWARILAHAVRSWLAGRQLRAPPRLMAPA